MSAPAATTPVLPSESTAPEAVPQAVPQAYGETVAFPATGLGEYRMPADAPMVTLSTTAEVYRQDVELIREHWDDLSDDELVEQAVREYAAMLGRKRLLFEKYERTAAERDGGIRNDARDTPRTASAAPGAGCADGGSRAA